MLLRAFASVALLALGGSAAVVDLHPKNFDDLTSDGSTWFLDFYAPWCGHCKRLNPILDEVAPLVAPEMRIGKIDATQHKSLAKKFDVHGYPSLRYIHNGEMLDYDAGRTKMALVAFAKRLAGPIVRTVETKEQIVELEALSDGVYVVLVSLNGVRPSEEVLSAFESVAKAFETRTSFGLVAAPELVNLDAQSADASALVLGVAESGEKLRMAPASALEDGESMTSWLGKNLHRRVQHLTPSNYREAMKSGKIFLIFAYDGADEDTSAAAHQAMLSASRSATDEVLERILFCIVEGARFSKYMRRLGARTEPFPMLFAIAQAEGDAIYHMPDDSEDQRFEASDAAILDFANGILDGRVPIYKQSLFKKAYLWLLHHWNKDKQLKLAVTVTLSMVGIALVFLFFREEGPTPGQGGREEEQDVGEDSKDD
mmetsp:Transcript_8211/g.30844  ORF Transcript_8211/g.30844 Transcript_8211/m.30844 type:complete len:428 (-) Transcript_8211:28-1311(-)